MKRILFFVVTACLLSACGGKKVTYKSLLNEMTDRQHFTVYSGDTYRSMQATGYDREKLQQPGPGAYIRKETNAEGSDEWVLMEDNGPGAIVSMWTVCFYGNPADTAGGTVSVYLDGAEEPVIRADFFELLKGNDFVKPPMAQKSGYTANLYLPIPYATGCKVTLDRIPFYYRIDYRSYDADVNVKSFSMKDFRAEQKLLQQTSRELVAPSLPPARQYVDQKIDLGPRTAAALELPFGSNAIYNMKIKLHTDGDIRQALRSTILTMTFDSLETVWCPLGEFFGNGVGLKPYSMWNTEVRSDTTLICRFVMPYRDYAILRLQNPSDFSVTADVSLDLSPREWTDDSFYFFANWGNTGPIPSAPVHDIHLFAISGTGYYLGHNITVLNTLHTWEGIGDQKLFIDDDAAEGGPLFLAAGTEDYYNVFGYTLLPSAENEFSGPFYSELYFGTGDDPAQEKLKSSLPPLGYTMISRSRSLDAFRFDSRMMLNIETSSHVQVPWIHLQYDMTVYFYAGPQTGFPMSKNTASARKKILTAAALDSMNRAARERLIREKSLVEGGRIAAPLLNGVREEALPDSFYGILSGGDAKYFRFTETDGSLSFKLRGYSGMSTIDLTVAGGPEMGNFEIFVNGAAAGTFDLSASQEGIWKLNLGSHMPENGVFDIQIRAKGDKADTGLLIDYLWINKDTEK